jgi:hypothetical protein
MRPTSGSWPIWLKADAPPGGVSIITLRHLFARDCFDRNNKTHFGVGTATALGAHSPHALCRTISGVTKPDQTRCDCLNRLL